MIALCKVGAFASGAAAPGCGELEHCGVCGFGRLGTAGVSEELVELLEEA